LVTVQHRGDVAASSTKNRGKGHAATSRGRVREAGSGSYGAANSREELMGYGGDATSVVQDPAGTDGPRVLEMRRHDLNGHRQSAVVNA
jgi:hypothetical protein